MDNAPTEKQMDEWLNRWSPEMLNVGIFKYNKTDYIFRGFNLEEYGEIKGMLGATAQVPLLQLLQLTKTQRILCDKYVLYPENMGELLAQKYGIPGFIPNLLSEGILRSSGYVDEEPVEYNTL